MTRLTIASLTATLAEQNINMVKGKKGYDVVMANGFKFNASTLTDVQDRVADELSIAAQADTLIATITKDLDIQTEPTFCEADATQRQRNDQLYTYAVNRGMDMSFIKHETSLTEDEELIGKALVEKADAEKDNPTWGTRLYHELVVKPNLERLAWEAANPAPLPKANEAIAHGFSKSTRRVSRQLQRRANSFITLLSVA